LWPPCQPNSSADRVWPPISLSLLQCFWPSGRGPWYGSALDKPSRGPPCRQRRGHGEARARLQKSPRARHIFFERARRHRRSAPPAHRRTYGTAPQPLWRSIPLPESGARAVFVGGENGQAARKRSKLLNNPVALLSVVDVI
jgi:hypothetical protein